MIVVALNCCVMCLQQWNAHFFLLSATKLYYTDETSVFSQNDTVDEDEDADEKEEEDNLTNANMEVVVIKSTYLLALQSG